MADSWGIRDLDKVVIMKSTDGTTWVPIADLAGEIAAALGIVPPSGFLLVSGVDRLLISGTDAFLI